MIAWNRTGLRVAWAGRVPDINNDGAADADADDLFRFLNLFAQGR